MADVIRLSHLTTPHHTESKAGSARVLSTTSDWLAGLNLTKKDVVALETDVPPAVPTHAGLAHYLHTCWAMERGVIIRPDMMWYTYLGEITHHAAVFPKLWDTKPCTVLEGCSNAAIAEAVSQPLPAIGDQQAVMAARALAISRRTVNLPSMVPYCGIHSVRIEGSIEEWDVLEESVKSCALPTLKNVANPLEEHQVTLLDNHKRTFLSIVNSIRAYSFGRECERLFLSKEDFYNEIFHYGPNQVCESNHPIRVVNGWCTGLYLNAEELDLEEFNSHLAVIPYKDGEKDCLLLSGLAYSTEETIDDVAYLRPYYGRTTFEVTNIDRAAGLQIDETVDSNGYHYTPLSVKQQQRLLTDGRYYEPSGLVLGRLDNTITICAECRSKECPAVVGTSYAVVCLDCLAKLQDKLGIKKEYSKDVSDIMIIDERGVQRLVPTDDQVNNIVVYGLLQEPSCMKCFKYGLTSFYQHAGKFVCRPCSGR